MRLFTTRPRTSHRPPEVRTLDLAAVAAARGGTVPSQPVFAASLAGLLSDASGLSFEPQRPHRFDELPVPEFEAIVAFGERRLRILIDRGTRRLWLAAVLGLPSGALSEEDLAAEPTPLEQAVLTRTLVGPLAEAWLAAGLALGRGGTFATGRRPRIEFVPSGESTPSSAGVEVFTAVVGDERAVIRLAAGHRENLDRAILAAAIPLVVTLDPAEAGVVLRAADLARFEPGDVLLTDLQPGSEGTLPVDVGPRSGSSEGLPGRPFGVFPLFRGHLGTAGARRGVRFRIDAA